MLAINKHETTLLLIHINTGIMIRKINLVQLEKYQIIMNKPLFQAHPKLKKNIPCLSLSRLPTPIQKFSPMDNLWIKRDDLSHEIYGGNKIRKLEFILAEALAQGKKHLITFGATGTNHGVATSMLCQEVGLDCKVFLFNQPVTETVVNNLKMMLVYNAELKHKGSLFNTAASFYLSKIFKPKAYHLFAGGSNIVGCISFVNAAFELKQQIEQQLTPEPDFIYCPVGSSSTLAGLSLGCSLAGLKTQVIGVRVAPSHVGLIQSCTIKTVSQLRNKAYQLLKSTDSSIPNFKLPNIQLIDNYYGRGYGVATEKGNQATNTFLKEGLKLDPTYTAKAAAAALDRSRLQPSNNILYWHTYNSADTNTVTAKANINLLPETLKKIILDFS